MSTSPASWTVPSVTSSTNLGPLITPLALPSDCLSKLWDFNTPGLQPSAQQSLYTYLTQGCAISSCCPSSAPYSEAYQWLTTYYSPAVCPVSYKTCAGPSNLTPGPSETAAFCCPAYVIHHPSPINHLSISLFSYVQTDNESPILEPIIVPVLPRHGGHVRATSPQPQQCTE
jgi:hypothetical protein